LFLKTDKNFNVSLEKKITFAKDYSDICYVEQDSSMWILSDESKKVFKVDVDGNVLNDYLIDVVQPEGIVVDYNRKKIFIVSDKNEELYEYEIP
jgi:uncharacterized protein YjiK